MKLSKKRLWLPLVLMVFGFGLSVFFGAEKAYAHRDPYMNVKITLKNGTTGVSGQTVNFTATGGHTWSDSGTGRQHACDPTSTLAGPLISNANTYTNSVDRTTNSSGDAQLHTTTASTDWGFNCLCNLKFTITGTNPSGDGYWDLNDNGRQDPGEGGSGSSYIVPESRLENDDTYTKTIQWRKHTNKLKVQANTSVTTTSSSSPTEVRSKTTNFEYSRVGEKLSATVAFPASKAAGTSAWIFSHMSAAAGYTTCSNPCAVSEFGGGTTKTIRAIYKLQATKVTVRSFTYDTEKGGDALTNSLTGTQITGIPTDPDCPQPGETPDTEDPEANCGDDDCYPDQTPSGNNLQPTCGGFTKYEISEPAITDFKLVAPAHTIGANGAQYAFQDWSGCDSETAANVCYISLSPGEQMNVQANYATGTTLTVNSNLPLVPMTVYEEDTIRTGTPPRQTDTKQVPPPGTRCDINNLSLNNSTPTSYPSPVETSFIKCRINQSLHASITAPTTAGNTDDTQLGEAGDSNVDWYFDTAGDATNSWAGCVDVPTLVEATLAAAKCTMAITKGYHTTITANYKTTTLNVGSAPVANIRICNGSTWSNSCSLPTKFGGVTPYFWHETTSIPASGTSQIVAPAQFSGAGGERYRFVNWTGTGCNEGLPNNSPVCTLGVEIGGTGDLTANYEVIQAKLNVNVTGPTTAEITPSGNAGSCVPNPQTGTFTAPAVCTDQVGDISTSLTPISGFRDARAKIWDFSAWSDCDSTSPASTKIVCNANVARGEEQTVTVAYNERVPTGTLECGTITTNSIQLKATYKKAVGPTIYNSLKEIVGGPYADGDTKDSPKEYRYATEEGLLSNTEYTYELRNGSTYEASTQIATITCKTNQAPFDYALEAEPATLTVVRDATLQRNTANTITATKLSGDDQSVSLTQSGLPSYVSGTIAPSACSPTCAAANNLTIDPGTTGGDSSVTVTGQPLGRTTRYTLRILAGSLSCGTTTTNSIVINATFSTNTTDPSLYNLATHLTSFSPSSGSGSYTDSSLTPNTEYVYVLKDGQNPTDPELSRITCKTSEAPFDYSLSASPNVVTVVRSPSDKTTAGNIIEATLLSGDTKAVTLSQSGVPAYVHAALAPPACAPSCESNNALVIDEGTEGGDHIISVTGQPLGRTTTYTLKILAGSLSCPASSSNSLTIEGNFSSNTSSPSLFSGNTRLVTFSSGNRTYTDRNLTADTEYTYILRNGTSSDALEIARVTCKTQPVNTFDYAISAEPNLITVVRSHDSTKNASNTIELTNLSSITQTVSIAQTGLPSGVTASLSPTSCQPSCDSSNNLSIGAGTTGGDSDITVTGQPLGRTANYKLRILAGKLTCSESTTSITLLAEFSTNNTAPSIFASLDNVPLITFVGANGTGEHTDRGLSPGTEYTYILRSEPTDTSPELARITCSTRPLTYTSFSFTPRPGQPKLLPSNEQPDRAEFNNAIDAIYIPPSSDTRVNTTVTQSYYMKRGVLKIPIGPDAVPRVENDSKVFDPVTMNLVAILGDQVCTSVTVTPAAGELNSEGIIRITKASETAEECNRVVNIPYVKVFEGSVGAGSRLIRSDGICCIAASGGGISMAAKYIGSSGFGASAEYSAHAAQAVSGNSSGSGFYSASPQLPGTPGYLTFANKGFDGNNNWGGNFGGGRIAVNYFTSTRMEPGPVEKTAAQVSNLNSAALESGKQYIVNGNVNIDTPGDISKRLTLYVNGNVTISSNINYITSYDLSNRENVPYITIVALGNIYIDKNVSNITGLFIAQPQDGGNLGEIFTCTNGSNRVSSANIYADCATQLTVNGAFIARYVNFHRSRGSLKDAPINENGGSTNIAEKFIHIPELYLGIPVFKQNGTNAANSYSSAPPIF